MAFILAAEVLRKIADEGHPKSGSWVAQIAFSGLREGAKVDEG